MFSIIVVVIVFSVLVVVHEFGHFIMARRCGVRVEKFSLGFGPRLFGIKKGQTEYMISAVPLGGYVKMAGETYEDKPTGAAWEFLSKPPGMRFKILISGPVLNYILGFLLFSAVFMMGYPTATNKVGRILEGYPAKEAGIEPGDRIIAIDGEEVKYWDDLMSLIHKKLEGKVNAAVLRDKRTLYFEITPIIKEYKDPFGRNDKIALLGITPSDEFILIKHGLFESLYKGFREIFILTVRTFKGLWILVIGRVPIKESMIGPLGIFVLTAKAAKLGFVYLFHLMAMISASLAIINILPIPALDGGHIIFLAIEKIRRRPVSIKFQERAAVTGFALLLALIILTTYYDAMRFFGEHVINFFKR